MSHTGHGGLDPLKAGGLAPIAIRAAIAAAWLLSAGLDAWPSPQRAASAIGALELSNVDGLDCKAAIATAAAGLRFSYRVPVPASDDPAEVGFTMTLPYLLVGSARPVGLAAFVEAPASAIVTLLGRSGAPLEAAWPLAATRVGAALGDDYGAYAELPAFDGGSAGDWAAYGFWAAPRGSPLSALASVVETEAEPGGLGWYDPPAPAGRRAYGALGVSVGGPAWAAAGAAAASLGLPGRDAAAGRAEARLSVAGYRLELVASCADRFWVDVDGGQAPFLRADLSLRRSRSGLAWALGWRYLRPDAYTPEGTAVSMRASCDLAAWLGLASVRARLSLAGSAEAGSAEAGEAEAGSSVVELDARYRPAPAPWLSLRSSWRVVGGDSERFDLGAAISAGSRWPLELESGLRFVPEGRLYKAGLSLGVSGDRASVRLGIGSDGWIPEGASWVEGLEYTVRLSARFP